MSFNTVEVFRGKKLTVGNFNNSIGFPRLTNNTSGMFLTSVSVPVANPVVEQKTVEKPLSYENISVKKDNTNYWLGSLALAASAIAGIYIARGKNAAEAVEEVLPKVQEKIHHPHLKDNFLTALGVNQEEVQVGRRNEYNLIKTVTRAGESKVIQHGVKRVEDYSPIGFVRRTVFETLDGKKLAEAIRNSDGEVAQYTVWDKNGKVLRQYNSEDGITHKFVYNKKGDLVSEVHYDRQDWSQELIPEEGDYFNKKEIEFGVNPNEDW